MWRKAATPAAPAPAAAPPRRQPRPGAARARRRHGPTDRPHASSSSSTTCAGRRPARCTRSPARYQRGIEDLDYEVHRRRERLGAGPAARRRLRRAASGPSSATSTWAPTAHARRRPSPSTGASPTARGETVALMIDGAHVLTPGVLHYGMPGCRAYEPASWPPSSGTSGPASRATRCSRATTRRSRTGSSTQIQWPDDGYRLFEIGHFIGDRDWFDGIVGEQLPLRAPQAARAGRAASTTASRWPGGGYANLDLFERLGPTPGRHAWRRILGEGSFHQFHGGTTTNVADVDDRRHRVAPTASTSRELRGRPFLGPEQADPLRRRR